MAKVESFTVTSDSFFEFLHVSQLLKTGENSDGEAIEG
jgi:hypothetical protein